MEFIRKYFDSVIILILPRYSTFDFPFLYEMIEFWSSYISGVIYRNNHASRKIILDWFLATVVSDFIKLIF